MGVNEWEWEIMSTGVRDKKVGESVDEWRVGDRRWVWAEWVGMGGV